jgi:hypothetical protein
VESVSEKAFENAVPTFPDPFWPAVMIGTPSAIVKEILVAELVPLLFAAVNEAVNEPLAVGVPVIAPVVVLSASPAGSPVTPQEVAGRSSASLSAGAWENATPTLHVKLCPSVIIGAPAAIEIVAVSVSEPPGPVAVSEIVALPLSCGVPVIAPVVVFSVAQLGSPVALQLVTGRFVLSVSEKVLLNAVPTVPEAVCPAVIIGTPARIKNAIGSDSLVEAPPAPVAYTVAVKSPRAVGTPVISPVERSIVSPAGRFCATQEVAGRFASSSFVGVAEKESPTFPLKDCPVVTIVCP